MLTVMSQCLILNKMQGDALGPVSTWRVVQAEKLRMKLLCTERKNAACSYHFIIGSAPFVVYYLFVFSGHQRKEDVCVEMILRRQKYSEYFHQGQGKEKQLFLLS